MKKNKIRMKTSADKLHFNFIFVFLLFLIVLNYFSGDVTVLRLKQPSQCCL